MRCDYNRSPCSMCSHTDGAHRHERTCRLKCGRWQVLRNNRGGFLPRASLFLQMPTATFRSTARPFDVDPVWHAVYSAMSVNQRMFTKTSSVTLTSTFACDFCKTRAHNTFFVCSHHACVISLPVDVLFGEGYFLGVSQNHEFVFFDIFGQFPQCNKLPE